MPCPHFERDNFLKYIRHDFPYHKSYTDPNTNTVYTPQQIKAAMQKLVKSDSYIADILRSWYTSNKSRTEIAAILNVDYSTIKRKLDRACDIIMAHIAYPELAPEEELDYFPWLSDD